MKEKYPLFYNSNVFFRDIQYAIISSFQKKDIAVKRIEAEMVTKEFTTELERSGELIRISDNSWKVNFPSQIAVTKVKKENSVSM